MLNFINFHRNKAFTLAEIIVVLAILGIVAALTIPTVIRRQIEVTNRTKLKKAMKVYDLFIQRYTLENNIHTMAELKESLKAENYKNLRAYFKKSEESCQFKTPDGIAWDICDVENTKISLPNQKDKNGELLSFEFTLVLDPVTGVFRVNDIGYAERINDRESKEKLTKMYNYLNNTEVSEIKKENENCGLKCRYDKGEFDSIEKCELGNMKNCYSGSVNAGQRTIYIDSQNTIIIKYNNGEVSSIRYMNSTEDDDKIVKCNAANVCTCSVNGDETDDLSKCD